MGSAREVPYPRGALWLRGAGEERRRAVLLLRRKLGPWPRPKKRADGSEARFIRTRNKMVCAAPRWRDLCERISRVRRDRDLTLISRFVIQG